MIDVLEGPDLAGKSTLARQLASESPNTEILRQGPPRDGDILEQYLRPIQRWCYDPMINRPNLLVMDRWHVGELIYGPILRGESLLSLRQGDYIDMVLQTFGARFLYVTAPLRVLEDRYDIRGDGLIKREQLDAIQDGYELWMNHRPHWVMHAPSYGHFNNSLPPRIPIAPLAGPYIGPAKPQVLLLGDERAKDTFIFPFVPSRSTSGHWLMAAMRAADVNHMNVGVMNACELHPSQLTTQWELLGKPPVITLGRNAQQAWRYAARTQETHYINHPQYMRRFHYTTMHKYGITIKDVMDYGR